MNEIITVTDKTPIEIALQIDEDGYTTAKALYEWLEMSETHYSDWSKRNIKYNAFAVEGEDFIPIKPLKNEVFAANGENLGGRPSQDYKISASFAKRLCMTTKSKRGEEARKYFIGCEQALVVTTKIIKDLTEKVKVLTTELSEVKSLAAENKDYTFRLAKHLTDRIDILDGGSSESIKEDAVEAHKLSEIIKNEILPLYERSNGNLSEVWTEKTVVEDLKKIADQDEICHGYKFKDAREEYIRDTHFYENHPKRSYPSNYVVIVHSYTYCPCFYRAIDIARNEYREYTDEEIYHNGMNDAFSSYQKQYWDDIKNREKEKKEKVAKAGVEMHQNLLTYFEEHKNNPGFGNSYVDWMAIEAHNDETGDNIPVNRPTISEESRAKINAELGISV